MEDLQVGALIRIARRRQHLRQIDVAERAGVSQQTVSNVEHGRFEHLDLALLRSVARAIGVVLPFQPYMPATDARALLDQRHAGLVSAVVTCLRSEGWEVLLEYSFNQYGDRGSVDIVAWRPASRSIALIEIKTVIVDAQELLRVVDVRERIVPGLLRRERGWAAQGVASFVVLPDETSMRRVVAAHASLFGTALPLRTIAVKRWLREPSGAARGTRGIWFFPLTIGRGVVRNPGSPGRIAGPREGRRHAQEGGSEGDS